MYVIGGGRLFTFWSELLYLEDGAAAVEGGTITEVGRTDELRIKYPDAEFIDAHGGLIMPGFINAHTHTHLTLARGCASLAGKGCGFAESDRARLEGSMTFSDSVDSAYAAYIECIKNGVTTVMDMHLNAADPRGTLLAAAGAACDTGIRTALGCGICGSCGREKLAEFILENREFGDFCNNSGSDIISPMLCAERLYSLDESDLSECLSTSSNCGGIGIAVSESLDDYYHAKHQFGVTPVEMLDKCGLIGKTTLLAHCDHIKESEARLIKKAEAAVAFVPYGEGSFSGSDAFKTLLSYGTVIALGTDGYANDMLDALKRAAALAGDGSHGSVDPGTLVHLLMHGSADAASRIFRRELGVIKPGACADIITLDYIPFTTLNADNLYLHMLSGMSGSQCTNTMVNGSLLMHDRRLLTVSREHTFERTRETAKRLWERTEKA